MRKFSMLLSVLVLAAMILAACGGEETSTSIPTENVPPTTVEVTATSAVSSETATEAPAEEGTTTSTPGIPVTGQVNSDLLSNELKFTVLDQSGKQVGKVDDMVLDLSKVKILYVVVSAEKKIAVPWAFLKLGTDSTSGQQNALSFKPTRILSKMRPSLI
jgi:PRC-barrel domain